MKQFYGFLIALFASLISIGTVAQDVPAYKSESFHIFPFIEPWDQGTFAFNDWQLVPANTNWKISIAEGNPMPSADFSSDPVQLLYSLSIETPHIYSWSHSCAKIWCDFDYKLISVNTTGDEKLFVDLQTEGPWETRAWLSNTEDKDWTPMHIYLTDGKDTSIKVRFRAEGANSADILHWYIDNIKVYITCSPPMDLALQDVNDREVKLTWNKPECETEGTEPQWINWDDGSNANSVGTSPANWDIAARWEASQVEALNLGAVTKIAFFPSTDGTADFRIRVWQGPDAATLLVDQAVPSVIYGDWNIIDVANPVPIDITQELWIGCNVEVINGWPAGCDAGPAVTGYGDMIGFNGDWYALSTYANLDYNWNLQGFVEPVNDDTANTSSTLLGYNLYRSEDGQITWNKLNAAVIADTTFTDNVPVYKEYCYYVTSLYDLVYGFTCESDSSNVVCVDVVNGIDNVSSGSVFVYPNPATDKVMVKSDFPVMSVELFNCTGQISVSLRNLNEKAITVNVSALEPGVYFIRVTTVEGNLIKKIFILR
jgi:hypothetical protein